MHYTHAVTHMHTDTHAIKEEKEDVLTVFAGLSELCLMVCGLLGELNYGIWINEQTQVYKSDAGPWNRWASSFVQSVPSALLPLISAVVPLAQSWKEQPAAPALKNKSALHLAMQQRHHHWLWHYGSAYLCQPCMLLCFSTFGAPISLSPPKYINKMSGLWMTISGFNTPHKSQQVYPGLMEEKANSSPSRYKRP